MTQVSQTDCTSANGGAGNEKHLVCLEHQIDEAEQLVADLKRILVRHEDALAEEGISEEIETIERWAQSYRLGMRAAAKLSEQGSELLSHARERLRLAADELGRMESEGPAAADQRKENSKSEDYMRASRRIEEMLPIVENMSISRETPETESEGEATAPRKLEDA